MFYVFMVIYIYQCQVSSIFSPLYLQSINIVDLPEDHRVIDIFVLLMIHSVAAHRKSVEGLLRKKLRVGCLTEELLEYAYLNHPKVLSVCHEYLPKLKQYQQRFTQWLSLTQLMAMAKSCCAFDTCLDVPQKDVYMALRETCRP